MFSWVFFIIILVLSLDYIDFIINDVDELLLNACYLMQRVHDNYASFKKERMLTYAVVQMHFHLSL